MKKLIFAAILMAGFAGIASAQRPGESPGCPEHGNIYFQRLCRFGYCQISGNTCDDDLFAPGGSGYDEPFDEPIQPARCSPAGWCEALGEEEILPW